MLLATSIGVFPLTFGVCSGEAVSHGLIGKAMVSELFLVVALTMALTPLLAEIGQRLGKAFEKSDVKVSVFVATSCACRLVSIECLKLSRLCISYLAGSVCRKE